MNDTLKLSTLTGAIVLGLAVSLAPAAEAKGGMGPRDVTFEQLDANSDGSLTQAEMAAHRAARFAEMDTDGSGTLDAAEITAAAEGRKARRAERMIERIDANGDGVLSQEELAQAGPRARSDRGDRGDRFMRIDADGDGAISKAEFDAAHDARRAQGEKRRGHNDG